MSSTPYLTVDEVLTSVKSLTQSGINQAAVTTMIQDESCLVDGVLAQRYKLPIDESNVAAINIIKAVVRYRVLVRIELYLRIKSTSKKGEQEVLDASKYHMKADKELERLQQGHLQLPNVARVDDLVAFSFSERVYREGVDQW